MCKVETHTLKCIMLLEILLPFHDISYTVPQIQLPLNQVFRSYIISHHSKAPIFVAILKQRLFFFSSTAVRMGSRKLCPTIKENLL